MANHRSSRPDQPPETWIVQLRELGLDHEPDVSYLLDHVDAGPVTTGFRLPSHRRPGRGRLAVVASAAAVLVVTGGVMLSTVTGGTEGTPAGSQVFQPGGSPAASPAASPSAATPVDDTPTSPPGRVSSVATKRPADPAGRSTASSRAAVPHSRAGSGSPRTLVVGSIRGLQSGRCLDVPGFATADGTPIQLWDCTGQANQAWSSISSGRLTVFGGSRCLGVAGHATADRTPVQISSCTGEADQRWTVKPDGSIVNVKSKMCLDAAHQGTGNSTPIQISTCNGGANQQWTHG